MMVALHGSREAMKARISSKQTTYEDQVGSKIKARNAHEEAMREKWIAKYEAEQTQKDHEKADRRRELIFDQTKMLETQIEQKDERSRKEKETTRSIARQASAEEGDAPGARHRPHVW